MMDYQVNPTELRSAASQFAAIHEQALGVIRALDGIHLGAGDFGRAPGQRGLYEAYVQHTNEARASLSEVGESVKGVSTGLEITAHLYDHVERQAQQVADKFFGGM